MLIECEERMRRRRTKTRVGEFAEDQVRQFVKMGYEMAEVIGWPKSSKNGRYLALRDAAARYGVDARTSGDRIYLVKQ